MSVHDPFHIDIKLLAHEINNMMDQVKAKFEEITDEKGQFNYAKEQLSKHLALNITSEEKQLYEQHINKTLAIINCFELNTGMSLRIKKLSSTSDEYIIGAYDENTAIYEEKAILNEIADNLIGMIPILITK